MKRFIAFLAVVVISLSLAGGASAASPTMAQFKALKSQVTSLQASVKSLKANVKQLNNRVAVYDYCLGFYNVEQFADFGAFSSSLIEYTAIDFAVDGSVYMAAFDPVCFENVAGRGISARSFNSDRVVFRHN
jgi:outer membrane murein-binding lipoprotein Lpp